MNFKVIACLLSLALSSIAFAEDDEFSHNSEYFHQAAGHKWELTPDIEWHNYNIKMNDLAANGKLNGNGLSESLKAEYGLHDMFAVGMKLMLTNDSWKLTDDTGTDYPKGSAKGLSNPQLYLSGRAGHGRCSI